jgi:hypothetical protein
VIIYRFRTLMYSKREVLGMEKGGEELIIWVCRLSMIE